MEQKVKDITIVSLSRGILGEKFVKHEVELGSKRLEKYGINVHFSTHALMGLDYIEEHPETGKISKNGYCPFPHRYF